MQLHEKSVAFVGFPGAGKNTAGLQLGDYGFIKYALGDEVVRDLAPILEKCGCNIYHPDDVVKAATFIDMWRSTAQLFKPNYWIRRLEATVAWNLARFRSQRVALVDVQTEVEAEWAVRQGMRLICIERPSVSQAYAYGSARSQELCSIVGRFDMSIVVNDGSREELGAKIAHVLGLES